MRRRRNPASTAEWSRGKLLALLAAAAGTGALLLLGLVLAVLQAGSPAHRRAAGPSPGRAPHASPSAAAEVGTPEAVGAARDALANRPMAAVDLTAARPGPVSTRDPGAPIVLPKPTRTGAAGVPTGFPRTPAGALAQLAAIDVTAMSSASLPVARAVIRAWALPGGPTATSWSGVRALAAFLDAAHLSGGGLPQLALVITPLMGLVKGTVGADFVVPCVDFEFDATLAQTARVAAADCQRMVWTGHSWMIGPGPEPADAPSVWPDTDLAVQVGYRDLRRG